MNLITGEASHAFFGGEVPPGVRRLLDEASGAAPHQVEALLWTAHASAPDCLPIYYLLYKFHASRREFELAEKAALKGIAMAARQAGLNENWQRVRKGDADFGAPGPARFWLFSLKALAFIDLRNGRPDGARRLLDFIADLDAGHGLGAEVVASLLEGTQRR